MLQLTDKGANYARAIFGMMSSSYTSYDPKDRTYLQDGHNENDTVYAVLQQMATKTKSVPFYIKRVRRPGAQAKYNGLRMAYKSGQPQITTFMQLKAAENEAFEHETLPLPFNRPNPLQSWTEFFGLAKVMLRLFGNVYIYKTGPEQGPNAGQVKRLYLLPPHLITIVVKSRIDIMYEDNPISQYMLRDSGKYASFDADDVIHVKLPNPNFDLNGAHLYGQSPLRAALDNIQSSNEAVHLNIKMLKNAGAIGLVYGKTEAIGETEAKQLKDRLNEMATSEERLSNIAGYSKELGFIRLSLTSEELKPFDYLKHDQKAICNVLGWSDKLLNSDEGAKYDNVKHFLKSVVVNNIGPDLNLIEEALTDELLPNIRGYENTVWEWDINALPEMQEDLADQTKYLTELVDRGVISRATVLQTLGWPVPEGQEALLEQLTVNMSTMALADALTAIGPGEPMEEED